ncbi:MAG: hypothetical protein J7L46_02910 [Bacteroidales bacterium]|nr:hypothetical protein [Bacteroidales bacterium]
MRNSILLLGFLGLIVTACQQKSENALHNSAVIDSLLINADYSTTFDTGVTDSIPFGWFPAVTGKNTAGHWELIADSGNKSVGQTSSAGSGYLFNLLILGQPQQKDLVLSVNIKAISGKEDQGGGLVWRYQNADNYYLARANPLENNFRLYKVINGNRKRLKRYSLPVAARTWHNIAITDSANIIKCYFDGQLFLQSTDSTINKAGKTGLWAKADAITSFDNFQLKSLVRK